MPGVGGLQEWCARKACTSKRRRPVTRTTYSAWDAVIEYVCVVPYPNSSACGAAQSLRARFQLPLGAIVHPLADPQDDVPVIQLGPAGIVRCKRCRTYINPFMLWQDGGRCAARPRRPPWCPGASAGCGDRAW